MSNSQELFLLEHINELSFAVEGTHHEMVYRAAYQCAQRGIDEAIINKRLARAAARYGLCETEAARAINEGVALVKAH